MNVIGIDIGGTSVKAVIFGTGGEPRYVSSERYTMPDVRMLLAAVASCLDQLSVDRGSSPRVGLCAPGRRDPETGVIERAVNVPDLEGLDPRSVVRDALPAASDIHCFTDAHAAAYGWWRQSRPTGRVVAISLGTGVGAAVLDNGEPLIISGQGPGHLGQIDVGPCGDPGSKPVIGPDGGTNTLEAYVGGATVVDRFGHDPGHALGMLDIEDEFFMALARAIRIVHAIYRPDQVVLMGGIGVALAPRIEDIQVLVRSGLTSLAKPSALLQISDSPYLAALGAAYLTKLNA